jgi:beta-lactam-binding protein with PASTA domain
MTADQALAQVGEFGWKIDRQDQQYDDATVAGQVIRQDPPPGSKLKEGRDLRAGGVAADAGGHPRPHGHE